MEKNNYLKVQQAARRGRIHLISQVLFLLVFLILSAILLSRVVPAYYYKYFTADLVAHEEKQPSYIRKTFPQSTNYSKWMLYRDDWFQLTQNNLQPEWTSTLASPFGKTEVYNLTKRVGYKNYDVAKVSTDFLFDKVTHVEAEQVMSQSRGTNPKGEISSEYSTLLDFLKTNGKYRVANVKVAFRLSQEKPTVDGLFKKDAPVELLRYGVDYPQSNTFGYPKYATYNYFSEYEISETDFMDKLNNLTENFPVYGDLFLYPDELDNFSSPKDTDFVGNNFSRGNGDYLATNRHDFEDVGAYLKHNGIKYSHVLLTGDCESLAEWLEINRDLIQGFEIQEIVDWNESMLAIKEDN